MSDTNVAPGGADGVESIPVVTPAQADATPISAHEAARQLSNHRWKRDNPEEAKEQAPPAAPAEAAAPELAETPTGDPPQEAPAEQTAEAEPAEVPPIEPPRSWTKEAKERWQSLPRETQEYLATREQERDREVRRSQNEAAEKLKGLTTKEQQVEQARQRYENALPALLQTLQEQQQGEFADIRTMADVEKLAREDWPRYALWDAQQKKIAAVAQEANAAKARQEQEYQQQWSTYATKQDELLIERVPELADKVKSRKLADAAADVLRDVGFDDKELADVWNGKASVSLRDARISQIIIEAAKYREAKANAAKPAPKPIPTVQRPGVSKAPTSAADANIEALEKRFEREPTLKNATALRLARQRVA